MQWSSTILISVHTWSFHAKEIMQWCHFIRYHSCSSLILKAYFLEWISIIWYGKNIVMRKKIFEPTLMPCICRLLLYGVQSSSSCSTVYFHSSLLSPLLMLHRCFCGFSRILPFRFWIDGSMLRRMSLRRRMMLLTKLQPRPDWRMCNCQSNDKNLLLCLEPLSLCTLQLFLLAGLC